MDIDRTKLFFNSMLFPILNMTNVKLGTKFGTKDSLVSNFDIWKLALI